MIPRLIKNEDDCRAALEHVDTLMDAQPGTAKLDELQLWVHLIEEYEKQAYPIPQPDPIAAIRFMMEQNGLTPSALVPYLGSKSKVSEVLSRKRPLSLAMIRRLHAGLGIPAALLIQETELSPSPELDDIDWGSFPLAEIVKRGWFGDAVRTWRELLGQAEELLGALIRGSEEACPGLVALRLSPTATMGGDAPALRAWKARVWSLARGRAARSSTPAAVDAALISQVAHLSLMDRGPVAAQELLAKMGIALVCEPQLPSTRLDGAAMRCKDGTAIVGLTLRYDRLDYFWFTLCHELAHLALHVTGPETPAIADDLEAQGRGGIEAEADSLAAEAMISGGDWSDFMSQSRISEPDVTLFAARQRLHSAIVAGRYRKQTGDYSRFSSMLGHRKVRSMFAGAAE
jgi:HTH-type transcriptional regulator / antitoxin HigA